MSRVKLKRGQQKEFLNRVAKYISPLIGLELQKLVIFANGVLEIGEEENTI